MENFIDLIENLNKQCDENISSILQLKNEKTKIFGLVGYHLPQEMLIAAGISSFYLEPDMKPVSSADAILQIFTCSQIRSILSRALKGEFNHLDGVIFSHSCDSIRSLAGIWKFNFPNHFIDYLKIPNYLQAKGGKEFLINELERIKQRLSEYTGNELNNETLFQAIEKVNSVTDLVNQIRLLFLQNTNKLSYKYLLTIYRAVFVLDKTTLLHVLKKLSAALQIFINENQVEKSNASTPIIIAGSRLDAWLVEIIENCGGAIAEDDLYWGKRWLLNHNKSCSSENAIECITNSLLQEAAEPFNYDPMKSRIQRLIDAAVAAKAKGIIYFNYKFCESYAFEFPFLKKKLNENNLSVQLFEIDTEYSTGTEQIKTRICSFIEMLQ